MCFTMFLLLLLANMAHTALSMKTSCPSSWSSSLSIKYSDTVRLLTTMQGVKIKDCINACCQYTEDVCWAAQVDPDNTCSLYYCAGGQCPTEHANKHWSVATVEPPEREERSTKSTGIATTQGPQLEITQAEDEAATSPSSNVLTETTSIPTKTSIISKTLHESTPSEESFHSGNVPEFTEAVNISNKEETTEHEEPMKTTTTEIQPTTDKIELSTATSSTSSETKDDSASLAEIQDILLPATKTSSPSQETFETNSNLPGTSETSYGNSTIILSSEDKDTSSTTTTIGDISQTTVPDNIDNNTTVDDIIENSSKEVPTTISPISISENISSTTGDETIVDNVIDNSNNEVTTISPMTISETISPTNRPDNANNETVVDYVIDNSNNETTTTISLMNTSETVSQTLSGTTPTTSVTTLATLASMITPLSGNDTSTTEAPIDNRNNGTEEDIPNGLSLTTESDWWVSDNETDMFPGAEDSGEVISEEHDEEIEDSTKSNNLENKNETVVVDITTSNIPNDVTNETDRDDVPFVTEMPPQFNGPSVVSSALIAALSFGVVFFFAVFVLVGKICFDSWQRRHYSRVDYLVNGMYN